MWVRGWLFGQRTAFGPEGAPFRPGTPILRAKVTNDRGAKSHFEGANTCTLGRMGRGWKATFQSTLGCRLAGRPSGRGWGIPQVLDLDPFSDIIFSGIIFVPTLPFY